MERRPINSTAAGRTGKIWIDLENSPHVPFFRPIIAELERRGYSVTVTARDCFQVCGLADMFNMNYKRIGRHYGKNKLLKVAGLLLRTLKLLPVALRERPDLALSHGSRSQCLLAEALGIRSMVLVDYEHTQKLPYIYADWMVVPEILPYESKNPQRERILRYPGIKEDVYVPGFRPDHSIMQTLGLRAEDIVATVRPPATEAHYHNPESEKLFKAAIDFLRLRENVRIVILPRNEKHADEFRAHWPREFSERKIFVPERVVDGLNLIWHSDFVISGGGTMNREAAALGVPVYSIFRGKIGAVDRYLSETGRLVLIESADDLRRKIRVIKREVIPCGAASENAALKSIVDSIVYAVEER